MNLAQRDVWWADLGDPAGSAAGFLRPVVIIQADWLNASRISTYLCVPLTSNLRQAALPTNVKLPATATGLERDSVAQVGLMFAASESQFIERTGQILPGQLDQLIAKLDLVLGRA
jgi:mRNA interferase MazF